MTGVAPSRLAFAAAVFDLDGVVTRTAQLHAVAWKALFDEFLQRRGGPFVPFDAGADYLRYVDGRPREEGVRRFLAARGITLPEGDPSDPPEAETIHGLAKRKDRLFTRALERVGVQVFDSSVALIRALRAHGVRTGVVTSSRHGRELLAAAGIAGLFDARVDGLDAERLGLTGKPEPDAFVECARMLDVPPPRAIVFEDAVSGVEAGRSGGFGLVVGVDRGGNRERLLAHGADLVVGDLAELDIATLDAHYRARREAVAWRIEQEGFDPAREHAIESLFTVANGYLGVRGALDSPLPGSYDDLFIAGVYDRKQPAQSYSEPEFLSPDEDAYPYRELVSLPFPFRLRLAVDGTPLDLAGERWLLHRRVLDLRAAVLHSESLFRVNADQRVQLRTRRCASAADLHLLLQEVRVSLEDHPAKVELDATLVDADLAARHPQLVSQPPVETDPGLELQRFITRGSGIEICLASRSTLEGSGQDNMRWQVPAAAGETLVFRRYAVVYTSRDGADPVGAAVAHLRRLRSEDFDAMFSAHVEHWEGVWQRADIRVAGSPAVEQALRFNAYHLTSAADRDPRVSVGARTLSGRAYEGHVFWDTEIFMLPFYLHTVPEVARHLLLYRHYTLDGARRRARELGYRGACYAWESTVTGDDVTPRRIVLRSTGKEIPIFTGTQQIHVTADVAYALWRYVEATGDTDLLREAGAEILIETARFWASRVTRGSGQYHIRCVVGPDEYHHSVDDNAYTNWMAQFNLEKALWVVDWLARTHARDWGALRERLAFTDAELEEWQAVSRELYLPGPNDDGIIEQFAGFFDLEDYPLGQEERLQAPVHRLFDWERINRLKLIKQADVLMLFHLFPERFPREILLANYRYYEPRTDHGSSLSPPIHAALAARLGLRDDAERYFRQALWFDLDDVMGNSALGVHAACMGGTWQALVYGLLGIRLIDDGPIVDPEAGARLPSDWCSVQLRLAWRGRVYPVEVQR